VGFPLGLVSRDKASTRQKQPSIPKGEQSGLLAHRDDGKRFVVHADEKLSAFVEREVLTTTFYLASIHAGDF
jgi:hypothetical protein